MAEVNPSPYSDNYTRSGFAGVHTVHIHDDPCLDGTAAAPVAAMDYEPTNKQENALDVDLNFPPSGPARQLSLKSTKLDTMPEEAESSSMSFSTLKLSFQNVSFSLNSLICNRENGSFLLAWFWTK